MRTKLLSLMLLFMVPGFRGLAQDAGEKALVKGKLLNKASNTPANDVNLTIMQLKQLATTDGEGNFTFNEVPFGNYTIVLGGTTVVPDTFNIQVTQKTVDLGSFTVTPSERSAVGQQLDQIPTIALEDNNTNNSEDDGVNTSQGASGLLTATRDPFLNTMAFVFGQYRVQPRGYERNQQTVLIDDLPINDVETGDAYWSQWGGLNDVFRGRSVAYGLQPSEYAYGGINGTTAFDATAENQRKQTRITYSLTNRSYRNRLVLTHSTGLMKNGWAFSISASKRWAKEGYVPGTFYDGYSYYAGATKRFNSKTAIHLITFGSPTRRGKAATETMEADSLAGSHYYNANWGYQNGEKRNSRVADYFQPVTMAEFEYNPSDKTRWIVSAGFQFGKNKNSTLDYFNGQNPRPDYYGYMPSEYVHDQADPSKAEFLGNKQINWDNLYQQNYMHTVTINNVNGTPGNNVTGIQSIYAVANDVDQVRKYLFNTNYQHALTSHITIYGGLSFVDQHTESYRQMEDLLGGDFYLNQDQFASQQTGAATTGFTDYDLNNPNKLIRKGDKYYYDYVIHYKKEQQYAQLVFKYNRIDAFLAVMGGFNNFSREGMMRNGVFPDNSYGHSAAITLLNYGTKGGISYKINGRNTLFVNAGLATDAPSPDNIYISPRTRDFTVQGVDVQKSLSVEGGYLLRAPTYNARIVGYATDVLNATEIKRFYDDVSDGFINYVLKNENTRNIGIEAAVQVNITTGLVATGVASIGEAFYTNRPSVNVSTDYSSAVTTYPTAYIKNYYLSAGPQSAYTAGLNYRSRHYWYLGANANFFDRNFVDVNANRRTEEGIALAAPGTTQYNDVLTQEKLPSAFTVDIFGGKSFLLSKITKRVPHGTLIYINAGISNLLDNKNIVNFGYEQLRYDFDASNPERFASKYSYGLGRNFFVNVSLKF